MWFLKEFVLITLLLAYAPKAFDMQQTQQAPQLDEMAQMLATNEVLALGILALMQAQDSLKNIRDERGATVLHILAEMGWLNGTAFWLSRYPKQRAALDHEGQTPLNYAQRAGHLIIIALLEQSA